MQVGGQARIDIPFSQVNLLLSENDAQVVVAEVRPAEVRPAEVRPVEIRHVEVRPSEVRVAKVRENEVRPAQVRLAEVPPPEVRPAEARPANICVTEIEKIEILAYFPHPPVWSPISGGVAKKREDGLNVAGNVRPCGRSLILLI